MKIAVTGHRPNKLGNAYEIKHPVNIEMGRRMRDVILQLSRYDETKENSFRDDEVVTIISGMALGVDTIWALVALKLKKEFPHKFRLECAIPCLEQSSNWPKESRDRYEFILSKADEVTYVTNQTYTNTCMQQRNEYMVDNADFIYAVWNGTAGGTKNCIDYARKKGKLIYIEDPTPWIEKYDKKQPV